MTLTKKQARGIREKMIINTRRIVDLHTLDKYGVVIVNSDLDKECETIDKQIDEDIHWWGHPSRKTGILKSTRYKLVLGKHLFPFLKEIEKRMGLTDEGVVYVQPIRPYVSETNR